MSGTYRYFQIISISGTFLLFLLACLSMVNYEPLGIKDRLYSSISLIISSVFYLIIALYTTHVLNKRSSNPQIDYRIELTVQNRHEAEPFLPKD